MADIFSDMALAGRLSDASPTLVAEARTVIADVQMTLDHFEKVILPDLQKIVAAAGRVITTIDQVVTPRTQ